MAVMDPVTREKLRILDEATVRLTETLAAFVVGPTGATDGALALFDGVTGKLIKAVGMSGDATMTAAGAVAVEGIGSHPVNISGADGSGTPYSLSATLTGNSDVTFPVLGTLVGRGIMVRGQRMSQRSTTGTTTLMCGLGSTLAFTPTKTGKVRIKITPMIQCTTANTVVEVYGRYGTGTAPANGAADTGTALYTAYFGAAFAVGNEFVYPPIEVRLTGLTVGTAYWVDLALRNQSGAYTQYVTVMYYELEEYV